MCRLCWVFAAARRLSVVAVIQRFSLVQHTGSRVQAQQLRCMGLVAPRHVGPSWTRDQTCAPCIVRWILNHQTPREALGLHFSHKHPMCVHHAGQVCDRS